MIYVGLDVHRDTVQVAARERDGTLVLEEKVGHEWKDIEGICARMPKRARYVMESSSVSHGLYRFMSLLEVRSASVSPAPAPRITENL